MNHSTPPSRLQPPRGPRTPPLAPLPGDFIDFPLPVFHLHHPASAPCHPAAPHRPRCRPSKLATCRPLKIPAPCQPPGSPHAPPPHSSFLAALLRNSAFRTRLLATGTPSPIQPASRVAPPPAADGCLHRPIHPRPPQPVRPRRATPATACRPPPCLPPPIRPTAPHPTRRPRLRGNPKPTLFVPARHSRCYRPSRAGPQPSPVAPRTLAPAPITSLIQPAPASAPSRTPSSPSRSTRKDRRPALSKNSRTHPNRSFPPTTRLAAHCAHPRSVLRCH